MSRWKMCILCGNVFTHFVWLMHLFILTTREIEEVNWNSFLSDYSNSLNYFADLQMIGPLFQIVWIFGVIIFANTSTKTSAASCCEREKSGLKPTFFLVKCKLRSIWKRFKRNYTYIFTLFMLELFFWMIGKLI